MAKASDKAARKAILLHGQEAKFWKPTKKGEKLVGKLRGMKDGKYGPSLRIETRDGLISVPINDYLKDADFGPLVGKYIELEFVETVGRGLRIYDVYEIADDIPF